MLDDAVAQPTFMNTQQQTNTQLMGVINQHRNAILALAAVVAAIPDKSAIKKEVVTQNLQDSKLWGKQSPEVVAAAQKIADQILA
jgi:hypothetical protein